MTRDRMQWSAVRAIPAGLGCLLAVALVFLGTAAARAQGHHAEEVKHAVEMGEHGAAPAGAAKEPSALEHVMDPPEWHLFPSFHIHLPLPPGLTKFMVLELLAALLVVVFYVPLAKRVYSGEPPAGWWDNMFESLLTFVRNDIAKPTLGDHDADRYVPFLWTLFLFILFNNLLGMFPFLGSATASIYVTIALAIIVFFAIHGAASAKMGFGHYVQSMWPHIDIPIPIMGFVIKVVVFVIEVVGVLVRNVVLAVRLFANMFAGHMVLATILLFIVVARNLAPGLWLGITLSSVLGVVLLSLLELFVAFLQAYIFVFLTSLFMGLALHPAH